GGGGQGGRSGEYGRGTIVMIQGERGRRVGVRCARATPFARRRFPLPPRQGFRYAWQNARQASVGSDGALEDISNLDQGRVYEGLSLPLLQFKDLVRPRSV